MQSKTEEILLFLDIFGQGIQFSINGELTSKTIFGGTLSLIMIALLLAMFFVSASDVLNHTNPGISIESSILNDIPEIILDNSNFPIAIAVTANSNQAIVDLKKFNFQFLLMQGNTSDDILSVNLNMTNCRKEFFPHIKPEIFESLKMEEFYCIENQKISLKGSWTESFISYVSLRLSLCINTTVTGEPCDTKEEIFSFLTKEALYFNVYFQDTIINAQNSKSPIIYTVSNHYKLIKPDSNKILDYFIRNQSLLSDDGFLFREYNLFQTLAFDYYTYDENYMDRQNILVQFDFFSSANKDIYHRRYQKIQEVLASVGGLATILKLSFILICYIFSLVKRDEILLNKIFDFHFNENENETPTKTLINFLDIEKSNEIKVTNNRLSSNELKDIELLHKDKSISRLKKHESILNQNSTDKHDFQNFDIDGLPNKLMHDYEKDDINQSQVSLELFTVSERLDDIPRKETLHFKNKFPIKFTMCATAGVDENNSENSKSEEPIHKDWYTDNFTEIKKFDGDLKEILKPKDKIMTQELIKTEAYQDDAGNIMENINSDMDKNHSNYTHFDELDKKESITKNES
jgi:hypothetical protein